MPRTISHTVTLPAPPERLFDIYMSPTAHGAAFDGMLRGRMLAIVPRRLIVQTWRGSDWKKSEPDSVLVLAFGKAGRGGRITLVHANIPERHHAGIRKGWHTYYWRPWRRYLARGRAPRKA